MSKVKSIKLPEFNKFIDNNQLPEDWTFCEKYMIIDNKKIEISFPENEKITDEACYFKNGLILKRNNGIITFITYNILDDICVFNHISEHNAITGDIMRIKINMYSSVIDSDEKGLKKDHKDYILEYLEELEGKIEFDVIK